MVRSGNTLQSAALGALLVCLTSHGAMAQAVNFGYTGATQTYTVPAGAVGVTIQAAGAGGGGGGADEGGAGAAGGAGASVTGSSQVAAGTVLNIIVGGGGAPAFTSNFGHTCTDASGAGGNGAGGYAGGTGGEAGCHGWSGGGGGGGAASLVATSTNVPLIVAGGGGGGQGGSLNSSSVPSQNSTGQGALPASAGGTGGTPGALDGGGGGGGGGGCPGGVGGTDHLDTTGTNFGTAAGAGSSCANSALVTNFTILATPGGAGGAGDPASNQHTDPGGGGGGAGSVSITPIFGAVVTAAATFPASVNAGQPVTGTVLFTNNGPAASNGDSFGLKLSANLATPPVFGGLPAGASASYAAATGIVTFAGMPTSLASGASIGPISVSYPQPGSASSSVTATFTTSTGDPNPAAGIVTVTITGVAVADLASTLSFPNSVNAGLAVNGTVTFANLGPSTASATTFSVNLTANLMTSPVFGGLPAGVTASYAAATGLVTLTGMPTMLAAGGSVGPISVSYTQPQSGSSTVSASVNSAVKDSNPANNSATVTIAGAAAQVLGTVFVDVDQTGAFAAGDMPVVGATVQLLSGTHVIASVLTSSTGYYSFAGEPLGSYSLALVLPPRTLATSPTPVAVKLQGGAPSTVNFGEIPASAVGAIVVTKTTPLVNITAGQSVPYTITATNAQQSPLETVTLTDLIPSGFRFRAGSGSVNGKKLDPTVHGRQLSWTRLSFAGGEKKTLTLVLTAGAGVTGGEYVNQASAYNGLTNTLISNIANATVRVTGDPTFDCPDLIGKVFDDANANGREDPGEKGIAGVRLVTAQGLLVTTDAQGRYHIACPIMPDAELGTNFILKLDERTLPSGYRLTTDNPETVRLTAGKISKLNFGAAIHRIVRIELNDGAFAGETLRPEIAQRLEALVHSLKDEASIIRLAYQAANEPDASIELRINDAHIRLESLWKADDCKYPLRIEEEIVRSQRNLDEAAPVQATGTATP